MGIPDILRKSIIVVAHPDDEILWFSSLLKRVNHILFCFLDEIADHEFGSNRRNAIANYSLQNISALDLSSLGLLRPKSFISPRFSKYGIELVGNDCSYSLHKKKYKENYYELRRKLSGLLSQYENVITHNPWGEYGHEEHIQVYRVINELQEKGGFNLWYSNYCSTRTVNLLSQCMCASEKITLPSDVSTSRELMELYIRNNCWTWYKNWHWPAQETFFKQGDCAVPDINSMGHVPLNLILNPPSLRVEKEQPNMFYNLKRSIKRYLKVN